MNRLPGPLKHHPLRCFFHTDDGSVSLMLGRGFSTRLDFDDYDRLRVFGWHATDRYAFRVEKIGDHRQTIYLHRDIMQAPPGVQVDHISGDTWDNRRSNLRLATRSQQNMNQKIRSTNKSGVTGVRWNDQKERWIARICAAGRKMELGRFKNFDDAVAARRAAEGRYFGEYARGVEG